ncbi:serine hydrolase domain-containing protein [Paenibacillus dendritiformis]|uniref:serine hydrolase domain-containing protein n=1 Tax=Paenibacillus dendritiformis TaxID=130049 RepID=UPI000DA783E8|nr:serine hydrolase domain-containing protein [Paenibacillus dendritiformis]PZM66111.1 penicillin-binding protein [Paenibacillus dendritiformis]
MKKIVISFIIFLLVAPSLSLAAEDLDTDQQIKTFMKEVLEEYHIPGASLSVIHNGQTIFQDSWGTMSDGSAVTEDTTFLIGSVSKPLTSLAIMVLVEDGKINLDAPIETYIPRFNYQTDSTKSITVRHLLEQTSGINAYDGMKVTDKQGHGKENGVTQAITELNGVKLSHVPGEVYEYNSANYLLLGAIIEAVSNQSFSTFMDTHIFSPLGMNNTTADYESAIDRGFVPGFHSWFGKPVIGDGLYDQSGAPYGYMTSTASDLTKFIKFMLNGGELLSEQSLKQLQTPPESGKRYGMGWHFPRSGNKYPYHTGATPEYKAEIFFIPEQNLGAVLLTNKYHELEAVSYLSIMEGIRSIMNGQNPDLVQLDVSTQWITLGIVLLLAIVSLISLIRLKRRTTINKKVWVSTGVLSIIFAVGLIPLFTYSMGISWRTIGLFVPDIEFLIQCLSAILAVYGLFTFLIIAVRRKNTA